MHSLFFWRMMQNNQRKERGKRPPEELPAGLTGHFSIKKPRQNYLSWLMPLWLLMYGNTVSYIQNPET